MFPDTEVPVTLLFTLSAADADSHVEAIMQLADILGDDNKLEQLNQVTNKEKFLNIIK